MTEYRLLKLGEIIQEGDEWRLGDGYPWQLVQTSLGDALESPEDIGDWRRPISVDLPNALTTARTRIAELEAALRALLDVPILHPAELRAAREQAQKALESK